jgi:proton-translocating NADH-quinone oxidoreductase chain N
MTSLPESAKTLIQSRLLEDIWPESSFYLWALPIFVLFLGSLVTLMLSVFTGEAEKPNFMSWYIAVFVSFLSAACALFTEIPEPKAFLASGVLIDDMSNLSFVLIGSGTLFTLIAAALTRVGQQLLRAEHTSLLLLASAGLMVMCAAGEFLSFFMGLEISSLSLYVLVGYQRDDIRGLEAAFKYFLLGGCSAAFLLMGMAFLYVQTGSLRWVDLGLISFSFEKPFALLGLVLMLGGLAFKLALFPFHSWTPDVYQGAHAHITGYMASLVKFAVVVVLFRIMDSVLSKPLVSVVMLFWCVSVASMVVGSLLGLVHNSVKRILAYSSVANAGYMVLAFVVIAHNPDNLMAKQALIAYAVIYAVLSLGAFTILAWLEDGNKEDILKEELKGLGQRKPWASVGLSVFLLGLSGIPPLAGFLGKFMLLSSAMSENFVGLSIIFVMLSSVSLFYYLSLIVDMWFHPASKYSAHVNQSHETNAGMAVLTCVGVLGVVVIGVLGPRWVFEMDFRSAVEVLPQTSTPLFPLDEDRE